MPAAECAHLAEGLEGTAAGFAAVKVYIVWDSAARKNDHRRVGRAQAASMEDLVAGGAQKFHEFGRCDVRRHVMNDAFARVVWGGDVGSHREGLGAQGNRGDPAEPVCQRGRGSADDSSVCSVENTAHSLGMNSGGRSSQAVAMPQAKECGARRARFSPSRGRKITL